MPMDYEVFEPDNERIAQVLVKILERKGIMQVINSVIRITKSS